jgi:hypothetical protein
MTTQSEYAAGVRGWFTGRLPADWFEGAPEVTIDREEITVVGTLAAPDLPAETGEAERAAAVAGRIKAFREDTRERRIGIALEAEHEFRRKVSWGVRCGERTALFTTLSVPVMTRLRQADRQVLDTLVDAGVARSRSEALAWSVRLVGKNAEDWLGRLRSAMEGVERVRAQGPDTQAGSGSDDGQVAE